MQKQGVKGLISLFYYITAIAFAMYYPIISGFLIVFTSILWLVPDKNIEAVLEEE